MKLNPNDIDESDYYIKLRSLENINYQNYEDKRASSHLLNSSILTYRTDASKESSLKLTGTSFNNSINQLLKEEKLKNSQSYKNSNMKNHA